ncbi:NUDIX domain-containing protein [Nocardia sp. NBC_00565]|uniref:NUDIX domain-containing protein n=1 Tax=Nocardia sp. NBC_00565 TaxID=2975993 RepID=UPI002E81A6DA|nr:NUDIX domain-containing protein [Nocardia sp. NBC_00565]WUC04074.1 NUDIX domain-containing protein [Nocardia sp. NBC_00565]
MGRIEYYHDPKAPEPNSLVVACNLLVTDESGAILMQRRRDTGQWALPGGAMDFGETAAAGGQRCGCNQSHQPLIGLVLIAQERAPSNG